MTATIKIYVDADACPVKDEIYRVAYRHEVPAVIVSNSHFRIPDHPLITRVVVSDAFDAADDYIAERANKASIIITIWARRQICVNSGKARAGIPSRSNSSTNGTPQPLTRISKSIA